MSAAGLLVVVVGALVVGAVVLGVGVVSAGAVVVAGCAGPSADARFGCRSAVAGYGDSSSAWPDCAYDAFRFRLSAISGAPVSITRVPGAGDWFTTVFAAYPWTAPVTLHAKPASSRAPFAKTNAWPSTSGT